MDQVERANRDVPAELRREITRYGGLNPFGDPVWRVVLAGNVLRQSFGQMRQMPLVDDEQNIDLESLEAENVEEGEFWMPRYEFDGWILERWFAAQCWGDCMEWENTFAVDGVTPMMGEWPRHGGYYMVSLEALSQQPGLDYWKAQIQVELRQQAASPLDPAVYLSEQLYLERVLKQQKQEAYLRELDHLHESVTKPMLATIGRTAQRVRDSLQAELGCRSVLAAG